MKSILGISVLAALAIGTFAHADEPVAPAGQVCERKVGTADWLPCGNDRVLTEEDLITWILKPNQTVQMKMTGGSSGNKFFLNLSPDGKMEAGMVGNTNIGKNWTKEGNKVYRNYYRFFSGPQCGTFELKNGILNLIDKDNSVNPITDVVFAKN